MQISSAQELTAKHCVPCEGGVDACSIDFSNQQLQQLPKWKLSTDSKWIRRSVRFKNFVQTLECLNRIGILAEENAHHPDLHVTGYRHLAVELTTHAIGGLSENDFILAAKIDHLLQSEFPESKDNA